MNEKDLDEWRKLMAKKKAVVTNAIRSLRAAGIEFETREYNGDGLLEGDNFGQKVAELTGLNPKQSFKTIVCTGDKSVYIVACVPVADECDLKKLAKVSGNKKVEPVHVKDILNLTGYIRGGVSPIGMKKKYETYIDESCMRYERIAVSAGVCGCSVLMNPADLIKLIDAKVFDII